MRIDNWKIKLEEKEAEATYNSILNKQLSEGETVSLFEQKLAKILNRRYAIATPNGSCALLLALMGIGISPGDEVIVPDITFIATANAAKLLGAKVVLADTMKDEPLINIDSVIDLITEKTKAIIPVHLNGRRACTKELKDKLINKGIYIIDDACQALFSGKSGDLIGCDSDIACYSFGVGKILTTGQGGLLTTDNKELYKRMKQLKTQGLKSVFESDFYEMAGFNLKFTGILASIGLVQLEKMQQKIDNSKLNYKLYKEGLRDLEDISMFPTKEEDVIWIPDILCENTDKIRKILEDKDIQVRPIGSCLHRANYLEKKGDYINSIRFEKQLLYLPGGPDQDKDNILEVIEILRRELK